MGTRSLLELVGWTPIFHVFLADDAMLFVEALAEQIITTMDCLNLFYSLFKECVNYHKLFICFSNDVNETITNEISANSGIPISIGLSLYLCIEHAHTYNTKKNFQCILDKVNKCLSG